MGDVLRRMFRYTVPADGETHVIPLSHSPAAVAAVPHGTSGWAAEFWAEHTEGAPEVRRAFRVFGEGQPLPGGARWIGTCARTPGGLVWHLYELSGEDARDG